MRVLVRLNAWGNGWFYQWFTVPTVFNDMFIRTDPERPYDDVTNIRCNSFTWVAPDYNKRNEGWWECQGFPFGAPCQLDKKGQLKAMTEQGWKPMETLWEKVPRN